MWIFFREKVDNKKEDSQKYVNPYEYDCIDETNKTNNDGVLSFTTVVATIFSGSKDTGF